MRQQPNDPNLVTMQWYHHGHAVFVWEDANEVLPWVLRWEVWDTAPHAGASQPTWTREETFQFVWDALARAAVIASSVENDERLVQSDLNVPSDRNAFTFLVTQLVTRTSVRR